MAQTGKVKDRAAPPFATKDGSTTGDVSTSDGSGDFVQNPSPVDPLGFPRPEDYNPAQTAGSGEERTGAPVPPPVVDVFDANARGVGSVGNARRPFKLKGGA